MTENPIVNEIREIMNGILEDLDYLKGFLKDYSKAITFVKHIEDHLKQLFPDDPSAKVCCKICEKSIDQIFDEEGIFK